MTAALRGKVFGNRGYISKARWGAHDKGISTCSLTFAAPSRTSLLPLVDKLLLRKRSSIKTLCAKLK